MTNYTVADCAKAIRKELKLNYPHIKFSVTSESFSMGDAVRIKYTDGDIRQRTLEQQLAQYVYGEVNARYVRI